MYAYFPDVITQQNLFRISFKKCFITVRSEAYCQIEKKQYNF